MLADAPPLPPHYGVWSTINEGCPPPTPDPGQPDPPEGDPTGAAGAAGRFSLYTASWWRKARFSRANCQWPPQRKREGSEQVEQRGDHGARFSPDPEAKINRLGHRTGFRRRTRRPRSRVLADRALSLDSQGHNHFFLTTSASNPEALQEQGIRPALRRGFLLGPLRLVPTGGNLDTVSLHA